MDGKRVEGVRSFFAAADGSQRPPSLARHLTVTAALVAAIWLQLCPANVIEPTLWTKLGGLYALPSIPFKNNALCGAVKMRSDRVLAPESFAFSPSSDVVFAGTSYGVVVALDAEGRYLHDVFSVGKTLDPSLDVEWCRGEALAARLAWDIEAERKCGRPLGLRLDGDTLWVADAYHGIFSISVTDGGSHNNTLPTHVVSARTPVLVKLRGVDPASQLPVKFFNDVEIDPARRVLYFTDSSYKHVRAENRQEVIDGAPRGRLLAFDLATRSLHVLLCGLHFPNGLQLLTQSGGGRQLLLMVESARFRVLAVDAQRLLSEQQQQHLHEQLHLQSSHRLHSCGEYGDLHGLLAAASSSSSSSSSSSPSTGSPPRVSLVSEFVSRLPGFPDNIRLHAASGALLLGLATKSAAPFSLLHLAYQTNWLRLVIGRVLPMRLVEHLLPRHGLVLVLLPTQNSSVLLQDPSGSAASFISEAQISPRTGSLWLGTHHNPHPLALLSRDRLEAACGTLAQQHPGSAAPCLALLEHSK